jgi:hypothetical protein
MMKTVTITVTAQDIQSGTQCAAFGCPVALAVNRHLNADFKSGWAQTRFTVASISNPNDPKNFVDHVVPSAASDFIIRFDQKQPVKPFTFDLTLPERFLK